MKDYKRVSAAGHRVTCLVCQGDQFEQRSMTLVTSGFANTGFNKSGQLAVCVTCGFVHLFFQGSPLAWEPVE